MTTQTMGIEEVYNKLGLCGHDLGVKDMGISTRIRVILGSIARLNEQLESFTDASEMQKMLNYIAKLEGYAWEDLFSIRITDRDKLKEQLSLREELGTCINFKYTYFNTEKLISSIKQEITYLREAINILPKIDILPKEVRQGIGFIGPDIKTGNNRLMSISELESLLLLGYTGIYTKDSEGVILINIAAITFHRGQASYTITLSGSTQETEPNTQQLTLQELYNKLLKRPYGVYLFHPS